MTIRVNGRVIPEQVVLAELKRLMRFYASHLSKADMGRQMDVLLRKAREQAIGARLLMEEALRRRIEPPADDVENRLQQMIKQAGGETKFAVLLEKQQLTTDQLRESIRAGRRIDMLIERITAGLPEPTEAEIAEYYEAHQAEFMTPDKAQVRHILVKPASTSAADRAACISKLQELKAQVAEGADFAVLAAAHSECPSGRETGGSLGWIARGISLPEFDAALFSIAIDEVSDVVETPLGFHLIQKLAEEAGEPTDLEEVQDKIRDLLRHNQRGRAITRVVDDLRKKAAIEEDDLPRSPELNTIFDSFLDSSDKS